MNFLCYYAGINDEICVVSLAEYVLELYDLFEYCIRTYIFA